MPEWASVRGMSTIFLCPGQGSQKVGMGQTLHDVFPTAKAVFQEVDEALGQNLSSLMFAGDEGELTKTENAQPALMVCAVAAFKAIEAETGKSLPQLASYVAGHSLGEYAALTIAGTFDITTAARLLKLRGQAMQRAVPAGAGAMAAILNLDWDTLQQICVDAAQGETVQCANDNAPGQIVISGHKAAVERAMELALKAGAKRAVLLPVSAPFHCSLMQPAALEMRAALSAAAMTAPAVPVIANVSVDVETDPARIRELLVAQVTGTVRWRESMAKMTTLGIASAYELGCGNILCGLMKRGADTITATPIITPDDVASFVNPAQSAA